MVSSAITVRWNPLGVWQRVRRMIRQPDDIPLSLQLGYFIWRVPGWLDQMPLPLLLQALSSAPRPIARDPSASLERIKRLSRPWFKLPIFRSRNTCYLRAVMFFRFLDARGKDMQIHFVVESKRTANDLLKGHAWVTVGDQVIEPPPQELFARSRSIYTYPLVENQE